MSTSSGAFGFIIGKKKRILTVNDDADLLWQILVREIYVLMNHYKTKECLQTAFENVVVVNRKETPKEHQLETCKHFTDFAQGNLKEWDCVLKYCQHGFINLLQAGYILNEKIDNISGHLFLLDFNKGEVVYSFKDWEGKINTLHSATIEEIMQFEDMPTQSHDAIVQSMKNRFDVYFTALSEVKTTLQQMHVLLQNARRQGAANIEDKLHTLLHEMNLEERKVHVERRPFY